MMSILFVFNHLRLITDRWITSIEPRQKQQQQQIIVITISEENILSRKNHRSKNFGTIKDKLIKSNLSRPISPPANEKIKIDLVDPIPTQSNSITNIFIPSTILQHSQSDYQVPSTSLDQTFAKTIFYTNDDLSQGGSIRNVFLFVSVSFNQKYRFH
jgi:hypothetical protein